MEVINKDALNKTFSGWTWRTGMWGCSECAWSGEQGCESALRVLNVANRGVRVHWVCWTWRTGMWGCTECAERDEQGCEGVLSVLNVTNRDVRVHWVCWTWRTRMWGCTECVERGEQGYEGALSALNARMHIRTKTTAFSKKIRSKNSCEDLTLTTEKQGCCRCVDDFIQRW